MPPCLTSGSHRLYCSYPPAAGRFPSAGLPDLARPTNSNRPGLWHILSYPGLVENCSLTLAIPCATEESADQY